MLDRQVPGMDDSPWLLLLKVIESRGSSIDPAERSCSSAWGHMCRGEFSADDKNALFRTRLDFLRD